MYGDTALIKEITPMYPISYRVQYLLFHPNIDVNVRNLYIRWVHCTDERL